MDIRTTLEDAEIAEVGGEDQATASDRAAFPPATRCLRFAGLWHGSSRSGLATMRESVPRAEASGGIPAPARATFGCDAGRQRPAAEGGAGGRSAKIAAVLMDRSRKAHQSVRPHHVPALGEERRVDRRRRRRQHPIDQ